MVVVWALTPGTSVMPFLGPGFQVPRWAVGTRSLNRQREEDCILGVEGIDGW